MVPNIAEWLFSNLAISAILQSGHGASEINLANTDNAGNDPPARLSRALLPSQAGDVRIGPILAIPAVLTARGVDPEMAFVQAGVDLRLFHDPDNRLSLDSVGLLLETCATLTDCDHFGLLVGERFDLEAFGPIGELMRHSATVGDALRVLLRNLHLHDRGAAPLLLAPDRSSFILGYSVLRHGVPGTNHIHDAAIAIAFKILRALCGPAYAPLQVKFAYGVPRSAAHHRGVFGSDVKFDADFSGLLIAAATLSKPLQGADAKRREQLEKAIREAEAGGPMTFGERLEYALHQLVVSGDSSTQAICRQFVISERTLRRRLAEEGKGLQQFINQTRYELARQLLSNTGLSVANIGAALHYADSNAFSRAFRNWAGASPRQWRALDSERRAKAPPIKKRGRARKRLGDD
jgi:AraC-like DNA-binding protein